MCSWGIGLGVAQLGLGIAGGNAQAKAAQQQAQQQAEFNRAQEAVNRINYERSLAYQEELAAFQSDQYAKFAISQSESLGNQYGAIMENLDQAQAATLQNINKFAQKAASSMSFTTAAAAESGVTGNSIQQALNTYQAAEAQAVSVEVANMKNYVRQQQRNATAYRAAAQNALNKSQPSPLPPINVPGPQSPVSQPSALPYVLSGISSGISAGVGAYSAFQDV